MARPVLVLELVTLSVQDSGMRVRGKNRSRFLARNKARVLIEQLVILSIHLSRHNILSTNDGDHICWHVMFGHRIESL